MNMFKLTDVKTPEEYIDKLDEPRRTQIQHIHDFICKTTPSLKPYIQHGMIGYGKTPYKSKSGREGNWFVLGLASQKNYISIYSCATHKGKYLAEKYQATLGKASIGRSCIRYKKFEDIPWEALAVVLKESETIAADGGIFQ